MNWVEAIILGALQGVTEFLPISSSGHLVIGEHFLDLQVEELKVFDVVLHLGTLLAILLYFWRDVWQLIKVFFGFLLGKVERKDPYLKLLAYIIVGTIPAVFAGLYGEDWIDSQFRNVGAVAVWLIVVGLIYLIGEWFYKKTQKKMELNDDRISWKNTLIIGFAQAAALIPGVSRSGSTIVAGIFQGVRRDEAARFSFLLGIPAIAGAGLLSFIHMFGMALDDAGGGGVVGSLTQMGGEIYALGFIAAFSTGIFSIYFLMKFLKKHSLNVFAAYLILAGLIVLLLG